MQGGARVVVVLIVCSLLLCRCDRASDGKQATTPGHRKMLALLKDIADRAPAEHQYFGRGHTQNTRQQLAQLGPGASDLDRLKALNDLGMSELLFDDIDLAIQHLTEAHQFVSEVAFPVVEAQKAWLSETAFRLAVAYLRLGETQNCCLINSDESCILPIRGGGVHTQQEGSRNAIKYFLVVLENTADSDVKEMMRLHHPSRWLLNIAYMTVSGYPDDVPEQYLIPPSFFEPESEFPRFENISPKLGLDTFNAAGAAIVDDFTNDDYLDIFTTSSAPTDQAKFFINNGDGTFTDATESAGLIGLYGGLNAVQADYNNDGNVDLLILRGAWHAQLGRHPNSLLRNNGDGTFTDVTFEAGLGEFHYPTKTAAWDDYDHDGYVDLYIGNESDSNIKAPSQLFRNNGDVTFTDVAKAAGVKDYIFAMGSTWGDYNGDRWPDLFVSAIAEDTHRLYRNNGDGTFTDVATQANVLQPSAAFAVWFWDFDNDGALDLYVSCSSGSVGKLAVNALSDEGLTNAASTLGDAARFELPALYRGDGRGGFVNVARQQKLTYPTLPMGANFGDLNGDGYLDFYLATGDIWYWELRPNVMFLNEGGTGFANVTMAGGFGHLQKGHGVAFADLDNDGDQDVYVQMGGQLLSDKFSDALFENPGFDHHWLTVKLVGRETNRGAIGARIRAQIVEAGRTRSVYKYVNSGGSFGASPMRQNIGLGKAEKMQVLEVFWPTTGKTETFDAVAMDQTIEIVEGEGHFTSLDVQPFKIGPPSIR